MRKLRGVAVLGGLVVAGLLLFFSFPVAGQTGGFFKFKDAFLRACANANVTPVDDCRLVVRLLSYVNTTLDEPTLQERVLGALRVTLHLPRRTTCPECLFITDATLSDLSQNATIEDIENTLHTVCDARLGGSNTTQAEECKAFIDQYVPQAIQLLEQNADPNTFCRRYNFCPAP